MNSYGTGKKFGVAFSTFGGLLSYGTGMKFGGLF